MQDIRSSTLKKPHIKLHADGSVSLLDLSCLKDHKLTEWFLQRWDFREKIKRTLSRTVPRQYPRWPRY